MYLHVTLMYIITYNIIKVKWSKLLYKTYHTGGWEQ